MASPLHLDVLVVPYKPIVGLIPPMSKGEATWPATSVSLISGDHDAVLVDALDTREDAERVVDWIRATGKNLTTIYITHGHGDHFFGLSAILEAFPHARVVTTAAVVPEAKGQLSPDLMQFWNSIFPGQIPGHPIVPDALDGDVIDLEGNELRIITVGQSDTNPSTIVYIPSLDAVYRRRRRLQRHPPVVGTDRPRKAYAVDRERRADRGAQAKDRRRQP